MKKLSCESINNFLAKRNGDILISSGFMKAISRVVTPYIAEVLGVEDIANYICIKIDKFYSLRYFDDHAQMNIEIAHKTQPFILCIFLIKWWGKNSQIPKLTDDIKETDIVITIEMDDWSKEKLKYSFFHECYFPVVAKAESGLNFDYQIKNPTEEVTFRIQFNDEIGNINSIKDILTQHFCYRDNRENYIVPGHLEIKKTGTKALKLCVDLGGIDGYADYILDYLKYLNENLDNIKKVVIE